MRFARAEANGAEDPCDVRRVVLLEAILREHAVVHQPLQGEQADDVRFGLLERRVRAADRLSNVDLGAAARRVRERRTEAVADLVQQHDEHLERVDDRRLPQQPQCHEVGRERGREAQSSLVDRSHG